MPFFCAMAAEGQERTKERSMEYGWYTGEWHRKRWIVKSVEKRTGCVQNYLE